MRIRTSLPLLILLLCFSMPTIGQVDEDQLGGWFMYFWNTTMKNSSLGFQGDFQYRDWAVVGDKEQLLLRGGPTYQPKNSAIKFTLGYAYVGTGTPGDSKNIVPENRIYQEVLLPQKVGERFYITHRYRFEQRFVEGQDFRTRMRYGLFLNVPLNRTDLNKGAVYLALYDELFINGQRGIGNGNTVELFDRNRAYAAMGYGLTNDLRMQIGYMQQKTDTWSKGQLQFSLHHKF